MDKLFSALAPLSPLGGTIFLDASTIDILSRNENLFTGLKNFLKTNSISPFINSQVIYEIVNYNNEQVVENRIDLLKSIAPLGGLMDGTPVMVLWEALFVYKENRAPQIRDFLNSNLIAEVKKSDLESYSKSIKKISGAYNKVKEKAGHALQIGKTNAQIGDWQNNLTFSKFQEGLKKKRPYPFVKFGKWEQNYIETMGKGFDKQKQGSIAHAEAENLEQVSVYTLTEEILDEVEEFGLQDKWQDEYSMMELTNKLSWLRIIRDSNEFLTENRINKNKFLGAVANLPLNQFKGYYLKSRVNEHLNKQDSKSKLSDSFDLLNLFCLPYCDYFICDAHLNETIRQVLKSHNWGLETKVLSNKEFKQLIS